MHLTYCPKACYHGPTQMTQASGGMDYTAVAMAINRFELKAEKDAALRRKMKQLARSECETAG